MRLRQSLIATLLMLAFGLSTDVCADLYWDSNSDSAGGSNSDTAPGTWGVDDFWSTDPNGLAVTGAWVADETAVFSADFNVFGTYDVTLDGTQSAGGIRFEEGTVTVAGGTELTLTGAATVNVGSLLTATINSVIGGSAGLTQAGTGTLVLNGANTYSGNTMMASNTNLGTFNILRLGASGVIPDTSVVQILGQNSIVDLNGQTETVKSIATVGGGTGAFANSRIDIGSGTLTIADDLGQVETYQTQLFAGSTGNIIKTGAGQLNLGATNSAWDGEFVLSGGFLGIGLNNVLGTSTSSTARLTLNGGTITFFNTGSRSIQTQNFDIINSFSALMGASNMELIGAAVSGEGTAVITLKVDNPTITVTNTPTTSGTFIFRGSVGDEGQNRGFTKAGPGTLTIANPGNTYGGDTTVLEGQLRIDGNATLGDGTGTVFLSGGNLATSQNRDPSTDPIPNPINVTQNTVISTVFAGAVTPPTPIADVSFTSNNITGTASTVITFRNDAVNGGANPVNQFEPRFTGNFSLPSPIVIAAGLNNPTQRTTRLNSANTSGTQTYSGDISGAGKFRRLAAGGTTVLTGANTYSGGTEVEGGTLTVSGSTATLGTGNVTVTGGALTISAGVANAIADTATLSIMETGIANLGTGINDIIAALSLGGVMQASGTYGSSSSPATFQFDQWFTGMGIVTIPSAGLPGDFNEDGKVDAADYVVWRKNDGTNNALPNDNGLGVPVGPAHYTLWTSNFGDMAGSGSSGAPATAVPEPTSLGLLILAVGSALAGFFRPSRRLR